MLSKATGVPVAEYAKAAKDTKAIGLPRRPKGNVEGCLFPSTLRVPRQATADAAAEHDGREDREASSTTPASRPGTARRPSSSPRIVEAEAKLDADRRKVARVILNRLETKGAPDLRAAADRTRPCRYGARSAAALSRARPSSATRATPTTPTSTRGCRPARSAAPGRRRSRPAANPADGPWFFFVAVNPDHRRDQVRRRRRPSTTRNVAELQAWCAAKPQDCGQLSGGRSSARPVAHSLSPVLHRAGYRAARALGGWTYDAHEVDAAGLAGFVGALGRSGAGCR